MAIDKSKLHAVGNLNSSQVRTVPNVFAGEDLENYAMVELFYEDGVRKAKYATATTEEGFLAPAVEVMYDNERFSDFYIGKGEGTRIVQLDQGVRFETSNYKEVAGTAPAVGQFASWDEALKTYQLSVTAPVSAVGSKTLLVVDVVAGSYGFGQPMIRFEVQPNK